MTELEIFEAARKLTDPVARAAYVEQQCGDNAELRASVLSLLEISDQTCEFDPPPEIPSPEPVDSGVASTIIPPGGGGGSPPSSSGPQPPEDSGDFIGRVINGRYKLLEEIGEGGQGTVYKAEDLTFHRGDNDQLRKYNRYVAVKLIRTSMNGDKVLQRFLAERQALAMMDHPHIAKFLDAGHTSQDGVYFVMELVKGLPIAKYCDLHQLTLDDRLKLVIQVSKAIQHAHQKGVIHRDLKPGNILVAEYDGKPSVKVIDFGLAKALGEPLTDDSVNTGFFGVAGTIQYMAPEQATFNQLDIDTRADVYSMTVVLYELLTGSTPHSAQELKLAGVLEQLRMVREEDPPKASNRLSSSAELPSLAAYRQAEPRKLIGILRRELDAVLMKGLEKDRDRRYESPNEFADDLERFLNREPVRAVPPSIAYRTSKYIRKHWKPLLFTVVLLICVVGGLAGMSWQEYRRAEIAYQKELSDLKATAAEEREKNTKLQAAIQIREADSKGYAGTIGKLAQEENQRSPGWAERSWQLLQRAVSIQSPLRNDADIRSAAATVLIADEYRIRPDWTYKKTPKAAAYSQSGDVLAVSADADYMHPQPRFFLLDATTGAVKQSLSGPDNLAPAEILRKSTVYALKSYFGELRFLDDGRAILAATRFGRLYRWDLTKTPAESKFISAGRKSAHVLVTPDQKFCVTRASESNVLQCWDASTLLQLGHRADFEIIPNGVCLVGNDAIMIQTPSGFHLLSLPDLKEKVLTQQRAMAKFHPSGEFFLGNDRPTLDARSTVNGQVMHIYQNPENDVSIHPEVAASHEFHRESGFSRSGQFFAAIFVTERGSELRVWDAWGGKPRWRIPTPAGSVLTGDGFVLADDAAHAAFITGEDLVQYSRIRPALALYRVPGHQNGVRYIRASPDGKEIAVLGERLKNGKDSVISWKTGTTPNALHSRVVSEMTSIPPLALDCLSYSPDGKWLATAGDNQQKTDGGIQVFDRNGQNPTRQISLKNERRSLARPPFFAERIAGFGWTSQGELIAAIDLELLVWNLKTNPPTLVARDVPNPLNILAGEVRNYAALAMNGTDDGWAITIQSELRQIRVRDGRIEIVNRVKIPGDGNTRICRISSNNKRLAIGKADGGVLLYNTSTNAFGNLIYDVHSDSVQAMHWLSERRLVTGSRDGTFAVWDVSDTGTLALWYKLRLNSPVSDIAPTADKRAVYVACSDETSLRVLDLAVIDREIEELFANSPPATATAALPTAPETSSYEEPKSPAAGVGLGHRSDPQKAQFEVERQAAEMVLAVGGSLAVKDLLGNLLPIDGGVIPDRPFFVDACSFNNTNHEFKSIELAKLVACQKLTAIHFINAYKVTDEAITGLKRVRVRDLNIQNCHLLTDDGLATLKQVRVRNLLLDGCPLLTDKVMASIATLEGLESLSLQRIKVTDAGIAVLSPLNLLRTVNVATSNITDAGLLELAVICPFIDSLSIDWSPDGKQSVRGIARFRNLMQLVINGGQLTDDAVVVVNSIPTLDILTVRSPMDDLTIKRISELKALRVLRLDSTGDESAAKFSATILNDIKWPQGLQALYFKGNAVSPRDEDLLYLAKHRSLMVIGVDSLKETRLSQRYTHSGLVKLRELRSDLYIEVEHVAYEPGKQLPLTAPQD